ncbi:exopolysaccharide biosynthesis polyprenyl glycosylphosphotransferase [Lichenicola cladoniae]|uniref:Exopolysaccharide biosynthesis polyprenyl glycosylphosphotransferase n=1 Tax=Lichenicola cladoniae TaxID=1484109 RepID=A0A6M8HEB6_9PROT|nr:exopolysaccharide biosynthesis polyprenyl glycosylphosphotransferase [Lichenicola cladoniae]NPD65156.1 exopolysaccharide biosynthesis polyprenyl glycosylphosphotransferase [Acetobacteraceae bacterium]QKE88760.1 exopolysaccharide biosynthesis polyprenyl glycosylphosphotransferase [Lichenicola cladoniae]
MDMHIASSHGAAVRAERVAARTWLARGSYLGVVVGFLVLEAAAIFVGGLIATLVDPRLATTVELRDLTETYLVLAAITALLRRPVQARETHTIWLLWLALLLGMMVANRHGRLDLEALTIWFVFAGCLLTICQFSCRWVLENVVARIPVPRTVAFLGNSDSAAAVLAQLHGSRYSQVHVIGFFDDRIGRAGPLTDLLPCLGAIDGLVSYIQDAELSEVYMALPWSAGPRISQLIERLRFLPLTVRLIPDHVPPALPGRGNQQLQGVVMPTLMLPPFSNAGAIFKRTFDLCGAGILLIPLVPLFIVVGLCIRFDSAGPVFFRQVRSGQYGQPFRIYKFRSLHVAQADSAAETLVSAGDRRVTRVGQILRKYSIDEFPQIFNVLLGQMSLVGPRPHAQRAKADGRIYAEVIPEYMLRYRVKPGMTGWAQVNGWRGNTDTEEQLRKRVEFDFQYIGKWTFWKDVEIMIRTVPAMLLPPAQNV